MDNFESSIIKPVEGLQNIAGLAPGRRREQRRNRQQKHFKNEHQPEKQYEEVKENNFDESLNIDDAGDSKIDFRA